MMTIYTVRLEYIPVILVVLQHKLFLIQLSAVSLSFVRKVGLSLKIYNYFACLLFKIA